MSKKSKKQPYRNALLKLKNKQDSLDLLFKENQRLNASALYIQQEAKTLMNDTLIDRAEAERLREEVLHELKLNNPYHPSLQNSLEISNINVEYAFRYRISAPMLHWDDANRKGVVKLTYYNQDTDKQQTVAYGLSGNMIESENAFVNEYLIENLSKDIANQMITAAIVNIKE